MNHIRTYQIFLRACIKKKNNGNVRVKKARAIIMLTMEITCQGS